MKRKIEYLLSTASVLSILLFANNTIVQSMELQSINNLVSLNAPCCEHDCQTSLIDEDDAEDAEDEEQDDKDTSSMDFEN